MFCPVSIIKPSSEYSWALIRASIHVVTFNATVSNVMIQFQTYMNFKRKTDTEVHIHTTLWKFLN